MVWYVIMVRLFKKGIELTLTEIIGLVLAFFVIVFFFIPLGVRLYNYFQEEPNQDIMNSLERLHTEISSLSDTNPSGIVPFYLENDYAIVAFNAADAKLPLSCKKKSCLCIISTGRGSLHSCVSVPATFKQHNGLKVLDTNQNGIFNVRLTKHDTAIDIQRQN